MNPTDEQKKALDLFATGQSFVIEAGAGTGKTSTLLLLAQSTARRGQYIAYNKAIVTDAEVKFAGANIACNTAHSLAMRAVGRTYAHRLRAPRMTGYQIAQALRINGPIVLDYGPGERKVLQPSRLAGLAAAMVTRFCQSADAEITTRHLPYVEGIDAPNASGWRTFSNNAVVARDLLPYARRMWEDLSSPNGRLPFRHDHYLKLWQLSRPCIEADYILVDEAQDLNPVLAAVVADQTHAQVVYVGDSCQQIYEWNGAVNALANVALTERTYLTQSFRFGPEIAATANTVLGRLGAPLRLVGAGRPGTVGAVADPDAILTRTNATAVNLLLTAVKDGRRAHLVGGGDDVKAFCRGARDLQAGRTTDHADLSCFDTWGAVQAYVKEDESGSDLRLLVGLVDRFGADAILDGLEGMPREGDADVVISTAHKSKGRQWPSVRLASDFNPPVNPRTGEQREMTDAELRLLYVAVTRAQTALDAGAVAALVAEVEAEAA